MRETTFERFGVEYPLQSEEAKQHFITTINKKYGGLEEYGNMCI